jgi:hypothetical protein
MIFRRHAMSLGIRVELTAIDDPDPDPEKYLSAIGRQKDRVIRCTAYHLARKKSNNWRRQPEPLWKVVRAGGSPVADLPEGWRWQDEPDKWLPETVSDHLAKGLIQLPADALAAGEANWNITVYWLEKSGDEGLRAVCEFLKGIASASVPESQAGEQD